ncbi:MAG: sugar ABC transporter substrate-binding protein [Chloroflexi bacterium]|nr:sugar ABC transporter substrate-binding protein [Chloroflexota bacterium]
MIDRPISRRTLLKSGAATAAGAAAVAALPTMAAAQSPAVPQVDGGYTPPAPDTTATLTISNWGDPNDQAVYSGVAERFKAKYPNVTVNDNFVPITTWTDYINKILADVAAGSAPDVINIAIEGVRQGISRDLFRPLTGWVGSDPEGAALVADVDQRLLDGLSQDGTLYLLPNTWNTMLIYYNTKMFADAGIERPSDDWTWDDFLAIAQQLTTGDGDSKVFGFVLPYFNFGLTPWYYSNGTSQLNADWTASNLTDPKMAESVAWIRDLVTTHGVAPHPQGADPYQLFPAGKAAMTGAGHWVVGSFQGAGFTDWDILPWPQRTTKATVYGVSGFAVHPGSQHPELAWEYCKLLGGLETQMGFVAIGGATPALRAAAQSPEFLGQAPNSELFYQAIEYALPVAAPTVFSTLDPAMGRALDSVLAGSDPAEALATADQEVSQAFADVAG